MSHEHKANISWKLEGTEFLKGRYSREHTWSFDGGLTIPASPSPTVVPKPWSNPAHVDPEEAFVASVASCHMLWLLDVAIGAGFEVISYEDTPNGIMTRNERGAFWISEITLRPSIVWGGETQPARSEIEALHHEAHEKCFIANSIKTDVIVRPE